MILLVNFQLQEHISKLLPQVFNLPKHHMLLLDGSHLLSLKTMATFMLLTVELALEVVNFVLGLVQVVSNAFDVATTLLCHLA
jgi:hypothetical protein